MHKTIDGDTNMSTDVRLRQLERRVASGDSDAADRLLHAQVRAGLTTTGEEQTHPIQGTYYEALLDGMVSHELLAPTAGEAWAAAVEWAREGDWGIGEEDGVYADIYARLALTAYGKADVLVREEDVLVREADEDEPECPVGGAHDWTDHEHAAHGGLAYSCTSTCSHCGGKRVERTDEQAQGDEPQRTLRWEEADPDAVDVSDLEREAVAEGDSWAVGLVRWHGWWGVAVTEGGGEDVEWHATEDEARREAADCAENMSSERSE